MEKGTLLKKRYLIEETLGRGGFGVTYLARDLQSGRLCALKNLSLAAAKDTKSVELFQREAQVLSNLDHPHIPDFIDFPGRNRKRHQRLSGPGIHPRP